MMQGEEVLGNFSLMSKYSLRTHHFPYPRALKPKNRDLPRQPTFAKYGNKQTCSLSPWPNVSSHPLIAYTYTTIINLSLQVSVKVPILYFLRNTRRLIAVSALGWNNVIAKPKCVCLQMARSGYSPYWPLSLFDCHHMSFPTCRPLPPLPKCDQPRCGIS